MALASHLGPIVSTWLWGWLMRTHFWNIKHPSFAWRVKKKRIQSSVSDQGNKNSGVSIQESSSSQRCRWLLQSWTHTSLDASTVLRMPQVVSVGPWGPLSSLSTGSAPCSPALPLQSLPQTDSLFLLWATGWGCKCAIQKPFMLIENYC